MPIEERFIVEQKLTVDTPIPDVTPGDDLVVTGTSSRKDETAVMVTVKGPVVGPAPVRAIVANGTWSATFDTSDAEVGVYTVKADDGDKTAMATVNLISPAPTPTATEEVTPTVTETEAPTPVETTATPEETATTPAPTETPPGFQAIFALAGLGAVAYLVARRRE